MGPDWKGPDRTGLVSDFCARRPVCHKMDMGTIAESSLNTFMLRLNPQRDGRRYNKKKLQRHGGNAHNGWIPLKSTHK